jgi:putative effector of murein hydrolase LrgA (UPF0299 family)
VIPGLAEILLFQGLGELVSHLFAPAIPGPVIGLVLLLAFLCIRRGVDSDLAGVAAAFSRHLGLLFVPAAVGVVLLLPELRAAWLAIAAALITSVVLTIGVTGLLLHGLAGDAGKGD